MIEYSLEEYMPLIKEVVESGGEFRLFPRGTSMLPLIRQGRDSVALVAVDTIRQGDVLLYRRKDGQYVLHRLVRKDRNNALTFCGDNHFLKEPGITRNQILASVTAVYRGEKRKALTCFSMKLYAAMMTTNVGKALILVPFRLLKKILGYEKK